MCSSLFVGGLYKWEILASNLLYVGPGGFIQMEEIDLTETWSTMTDMTSAEAMTLSHAVYHGLGVETE